MMARAPNVHTSVRMEEASPWWFTVIISPILKSTPHDWTHRQADREAGRQDEDDEEEEDE